jgi:quinolinate synthase
MQENKANIARDIEKLKKEQDALILAHYYQPLEIQDLADFVGDSFDLSVKSRDAEQSIIVFCGVYFMAETAKILSPEKTVLSPNPRATCPMARMITVAEIEALQKKYPGAEVVCYVNTTAEVKAVSDVCVTSSSAQSIVNKLDSDKIIFVPDKNLGAFIQRSTDKNIIIGEGFCYVHNRFLAENIKKGKANYPEAKVLVHPECPPDVIDMADEAMSTAGMLSYVKHNGADTYIIGTENGLIELLQREYPGKKFFSAGPPSLCVNMKKIKQEDVYQSLENKQHEVHLPEDIIKKASKSLERMIALK